MLKITYGIDASEDDYDEYMATIDAALEGPSQGLVPGKFLVQYFPFLRYIPAWIPGATSQKLWAKWHAAAEKLKNTPFEFAEKHLVRDLTCCCKL